MKNSFLVSSSLIAASCGLAVLGIPSNAQAQSTDVDLELLFLVDVSGSVNATEFNLQRTGYVNAFNDSAIANALTSGPFGRAAVSMVYWSRAPVQ